MRAVRDNLSTEDREALLTPCGCGHTINDHGSIVACWRCEDEGGDCSTPFEALLADRMEGIVARHVAEALREAADVMSAQLDMFPQQGRHTRARWAEAFLRARADQIGGTP